MGSFHQWCSGVSCLLTDSPSFTLCQGEENLKSFSQGQSNLGLGRLLILEENGAGAMDGKSGKGGQGKLWEQL